MWDNKLNIVELSLSDSLKTGSLKQFLVELAYVLGKDAEATKVEFWLYRAEGPQLESVMSLDAFSGAELEKYPMKFRDHAYFFEAYMSNHILHTHTDYDEEDLLTFKDQYIPGHEKRSWVGINVNHDGKPFGLLGYVRKGTIEPNQFEELLLVTAASLINQCYDSLLRNKEEELRAREFERQIAEKLDEEKELLIRKLNDHAFYTSHHVRHPLATIQALVELIKISWEERHSYEKYVKQIKIETMHLDEAIKVMTAKIQLD